MGVAYSQGGDEQLGASAPAASAENHPIVNIG
jgi:hypothetical protein